MNTLAQIFKSCSNTAEPIEVNIKPVTPSLPGVSAVIFDVYGTLFQSAVGDISLISDSSSNARESASRRVIESAGGKLRQLDFQISDALTETIKVQQQRTMETGTQYPEVNILNVWAELLRDLEERGILEFDSEIEIDLEKLSAHFEALVNPVTPMPGALELIQSLQKKGYILGIVSNAQFFTPLLFDAFFNQSISDLGFSPDLCFWSFEHLKAKPGTDLYQMCAEVLVSRYGTTTEKALFVGNDLRNDVWPAQKVGFQTALFAGDKRSYRPREDDPNCADVKPSALTTDLSQILQVVS